MRDRPKNMSDWLVKIEPDQNLSRMTDITLTPWNRLMQWFSSRVIQPAVNIGNYNPDTGYVVLGKDSPVPGGYFVSDVVKSLTITCPAGYRYRIYFAGGVNVTQASYTYIQITLTGFAQSGLVKQSPTNGQAEYNGVIGATDNNLGDGIMNELWLNAGESLFLDQTAFAALDNVEYLILWEKYRA